MNAIYYPDYTTSSNLVNSIYESDEHTLSQLDALYLGHDVIHSSMCKALTLGGTNEEDSLEKLETELDNLLSRVMAEEAETVTITQRISDKDLTQKSTDLRQRYAQSAKRAQDWETLIYSDIHSYDFQALDIKIKPVIDFLTLQFPVNKAMSRSCIKKYLTEKTGNRYYIHNDENAIQQYGNLFSIQVHDVRSKKDLNAVIKALAHFGVTSDQVRILRIETSIDFYNAKSKALLIAVYKSLSYVEDSNNKRVYKNKREFVKAPSCPIALLDKLEDGYCIGINHRNSATYYRAYYKTTDRSATLATSEHRLRIEVNCSVEALKVDDGLSNLPTIIQRVFNLLKFTKLSLNASKHEKQRYNESVDIFGKRVREQYSATRHKRNLNKTIIKHAQLNTLISKKVSDLKRNF